MRENRYQAQLIDELHRRFPGCIVLKNDPNYLQGVPDLLLLVGDCWAMLEVKAAADSAVRPNQAYYVRMMDEMSFAAFIYPEVQEEVLDALQQSFEARWDARVPLRE